MQSNKQKIVPSERLSPSEFMRGLRPECYSDSALSTRYKLDQATFEHYLETITARNETHKFEIFCRKLAEATICRNLRPATGPEGGGDSKADAETYSVAPEVAELFYIGYAGSTTERWAFAFSAKQKWKEKVKSDVEGIVKTNRDYKKIICITSRSARAKDRARLEDDLTKTHGIPVTIHDRSWIVKEIIEYDRQELAHTYLNVGEEVIASRNLGPLDYSKTQRLEDIERLLADERAFAGMEGQLASEALAAAELSRNLEKPRLETDGRFARAIRLADKYGNSHQKIESRYEKIWTAFWWFDDFSVLHESYDELAKLIFESPHVKNLEYLANLIQLLLNLIIHGTNTADECKLTDRVHNLRSKLTPIVSYEHLPNSRLEAKTLLLTLRVNEAMLSKDRTLLPVIWREFLSVVEEARGLGEFEATRLIRMVDVFGAIAGEDPDFSKLVDAVADFAAERAGEVASGRLLLNRARQISDNHFEVIRLLGKASRRLTKKEHTNLLIEATSLLASAYYDADLWWAARATCAFAAASVMVDSETDALPSLDLIPIFHLWAWTALRLGHLPDFLYAFQALTSLSRLPLENSSLEKLNKEILDLDRAFAALLLNLHQEELIRLRTIPDILEASGAIYSRTALLYAFGREDLLREEGIIPENEKKVAVEELFTRLRNITAVKLSKALILNNESNPVRRTVIVGMTVKFVYPNTETSIILAEAIIGCLEAYLATAMDYKLIPHTENYTVGIKEVEPNSKPKINSDLESLLIRVEWPRETSPASYKAHAKIHDVVRSVFVNLIVGAFFIPDHEAFLKSLFEDEVVNDRISTIIASATSYHRVTGRYHMTLDVWAESIHKCYLLAGTLPELTITQNAEQTGQTIESNLTDAEKDAGHFAIQAESHQDLTVRSIVNVHLWDRAKWRGMAFIESPAAHIPPIMGFIFEDIVAGEKIFSNWRERFSEIDHQDDIYIAIVREISPQFPAFYNVLVTSKLPPVSADEKLFMFASRINGMRPSSDANLNRFLDRYSSVGHFLIAPIFIRKDGSADIKMNVSLKKKNLSVKRAIDVRPNAIEIQATKFRDDQD